MPARPLEGNPPRPRLIRGPAGDAFGALGDLPPRFFRAQRGAEAWRHHLLPENLQWVMKSAVVRSGVGKRATSHTSRDSLAAHLLESGTVIRTVQNLLGHKDVTRTPLDTHVMQKPGLGVRSPLDG